VQHKQSFSISACRKSILKACELCEFVHARGWLHTLTSMITAHVCWDSACFDVRFHARAVTRHSSSIWLLFQTINVVARTHAQMRQQCTQQLRQSHKRVHVCTPGRWRPSHVISASNQIVVRMRISVPHIEHRTCVQVANSCHTYPCDAHGSLGSCMRRAYYGEEGGKPMYCGEHAEKGMKFRESCI
jgi:hypothetical protein